MGKKNVVYIISFIAKSKVFEWTIDLLNTNKFNYLFILLNKEETPFELYLKDKGFETIRIHYRGKKDVLPAIINTRKILRKYKADVVHTHLFDAGIVGLIAAKLTGVKKRLYTRHYSTLHHEYHPHAVIYDRLINFICTDIIAVSQVVKDVLIEKERVKPEKVHIVYHGFKRSEFDDITKERIAMVRSKYDVPLNVPVIGVVSRYIHWKGIQYIIAAFNALLKQYPDACLVLANADGPDKKEIRELLDKLPPKNYREIQFEYDILALFRLFHIFVHVPIDSYSEAFGQAYIEAMLSKIPCIFTLSGIANEIIRNNENALVVNYKDDKDIYMKLNELVENSDLRAKLTENAYSIAVKMFPPEVMIGVEKFYE